jgi:hypothetical protein
MDEYVPYAQRALRQQEEHQREQTRASDGRSAKEERIRALLRKLDGRGTDRYLELLRKAGVIAAAHARITGKPLVKAANETLQIVEVLPVYTLNGVTSVYRQKSSSLVMDRTRGQVYIAPDERVWLSAGPIGFTTEGNTTQVYAHSDGVEDLNDDELTLVADALSTRLTQVDTQ